MVDDRSEFEENNNPPELEENFARTRPQPFVKEPEYQELLQTYQNGELDASARLIEALLRKYPGDPSLLDFQREVIVKISMQDTSVKTEKAERRSNLVKYTVRGGIALVIIMVIVGGILIAINRFETNRTAVINAQETATMEEFLNSKLDKAESWLRGNRPLDALEELQDIQEIDPNFDGIDNLISEAERQLALLDKYEQANVLYSEGKLSEAQALFNEIVNEESNYRDARQMIQKISEEMEIDQLLDQIQSSYQNGSWQAVIDAYDQITSLDPSHDIGDLDDILFNSYKERIIEIAGQDEPTVEDIEKAQDYYRKALALFPQDRGYAAEREELQQIASQLIGNKFYLFAVSLLDTGGYSPENMREVLRLLERANSIGSGSPAVSAEIERVELFVTGFEALLDNSNDIALESLERLNQLEPDYADGFVQYLLYEAYLARGAALTAFADFESAREDYELAETYARGKYGNQMRVFWAEIQIARMLRRLTLHAEAAEYFNFAFNLIDFDTRVRNSGNIQLIEDYEDAKSALAVNDDWNAARLFEIVLEDIEVAYSFEPLSVLEGHTVFEASFEVGSTVDALRSYNELGVATYFRDDQEIQVPYIEE